MTERFAVQPALTQVAEAQGRRQNWLAEQAGISTYRLSRAVTGKGTLPRPAAERIASALQVPFSLLFETTCVQEIATTENVS